MTDILGIDPGKRTGIVLVEYNDTYPGELVASWDIVGGADRFIEWLSEHDAIMNGMRNMFVVYESFTNREGKHGVGTDASEVIGVLLHWAKEQGISAVPQPPAGRMAAVPNKVLDKFYKFTGKGERNEKEAFRHVIWYLKNAKHMPTIQKGWLDGD